ncbi:MAG TPA: bifunctional polysaccharide deacetylase/glycosyltransferase family 2 protein [Pseudonocardia sp.]|jgi:cellulose synthase/poly-beta-1,6-N-acetylglucosamine synthase-like glycosyltransferase/peptidoglycan/xylan/chitin deacetylase (PgdA/CDA1 family)|nr:bifunctional polysaccharide deacetylase/glycosyltransferase family 2 protein [Pseudonocardia sp.]
MVLTSPDHVRSRRSEVSEQVGRRHLPRPRWLLIVVVFTMFCCVLLTNGLVTSEIGIDAEGATVDGPDNAVPLAVSEGGPVIDLTHGRARTYAMPPKTVALTFDDGPDPEWTPRVLDVLEKYHVPATFFVIGSSVARHPELVRRIRATGSEVGVHTFTHPDLRTVSAGRVDREIAETQIALAGATGEISYLVRPPYSSESSAVDNAGFGVLTRLGQQGYVTALVDVDSNDWQRPGVARIVHDAVPPFGQGGVVLLHDAGGNRVQTVQALDQLIPRMQAQGYRFTTLTAGVHLPPADVVADPSDLVLGRVMLFAVRIATGFVSALEWSLLIVGGLVILRLIVMVWVAVGHHRRRRRPDFIWSPGAGEIGPVTVVVPAHNEKECIAQTVRSLAASTHPVEIIVVDDGSTDDTAAIVGSLRLPCVRVVRQPNGGKSTALNTGIALASYDVIVMMDGDTVFEPSTISELVAPFADPGVGAVAGNARVGDRGRLISKWQHIEYVIGFNIDRRAQDRWRAITTVPGAVGAFRAQALAEAGGVSSDTLAEDTDLTIAIGRAGWRVVYQPTARAWTEAPATFGQLWRQRYRWSYGILQSLWKHRGAFRDGVTPKRLAYLGMGTTAMFQIVLPLLAPMVDVYLVYGMVFLAPVRTAVIWASVMAIQLVSGAIAFRLEGERLRGLWLLPLQQLVYRQLMYAVLIQSISTALAGSRLGWQKAPRIGQFSAAPPV